MRKFAMAGVAGALLVLGAAGRARADARAEIVSTAMIWDGAARCTTPDLVRFGGRWFLVCQESERDLWSGGELRVLTSADGKKWEAVARIESPTPERGLLTPTFTLEPDGRLMISALGFMRHPSTPGPLTEFGGMLKTLAWYSADGRDWQGPRVLSPDHFPFGRIVRHEGIAYGYAFGRCCGRSSTVQLFMSRGDRAFECRYMENFSEFAPFEAALLFEGDTGYCLMNRSMDPGIAGKTGLLGKAKAPYATWQWTEMDRRISHPNPIRLPDGRVLATIGLYDRTIRTSLCEFHPATGTLTDLMALPTDGQAVPAGLAWHDGHAWISYHARRGDNLAIYLAKVKLP